MVFIDFVLSVSVIIKVKHNLYIKKVDKKQLQTEY